MSKLEFKVDGGKVELDFDDRGASLRIYDHNNCWMGSAGVGISGDGKHWGTWCSDTTKDEWSTKFIAREVPVDGNKQP